MSIELVTPSGHLILCRPLLLLPPIPLSIRVFSNGSTLPLRWPKCWSFIFSISPSNEHPGLISLRMDWLDLLAVQGTLKSLLQHHTSKASILWRSAFFTVQLLDPFRYDLNQIPCNYTVKVTNRFKRLDLIDRMPEEQWTEVCNIGRWCLKLSPRRRNAKGKMVV